MPMKAPRGAGGGVQTPPLLLVTTQVELAMQGLVVLRLTPVRAQGPRPLLITQTLRPGSQVNPAAQLPWPGADEVPDGVQVARSGTAHVLLTVGMVAVEGGVVKVVVLSQVKPVPQAGRPVPQVVPAAGMHVPLVAPVAITQVVPATQVPVPVATLQAPPAVVLGVALQVVLHSTAALAPVVTQSAMVEQG